MKDNTSDSQWKNMLRADLNASRPLVYAGFGNGGHCFVCDGYDNSDMFHFNWGWDGQNDGFYSLSALNPGSGGAGGGSYSFTNNQQAIFGLEPTQSGGGGGGGSSTNADLRLYSELSVENQIWFYGPCYDEQKNAELLYNAAVCVCPAAVGLTAIHALSFGTPVVSNDEFDAQMPEFEAVKKDVTGSFYKADDTEDLAHEILRWTRKTPKERAKIREEARHEITESWSIAYQIGILRHAFPQYFYTSSR